MKCTSINKARIKNRILEKVFWKRYAMAKTNKLLTAILIELKRKNHEKEKSN